MEGVICDVCKKSAFGIKEFFEASHVRSCVVEDGFGRKRTGWEMVFKNRRELCFPCYRRATNSYVKQTHALKGKDVITC